MEGHSLLPFMAGEVTIRDVALFGYFGGAVNVTDGRHTYFRYPPDIATQEIYQYTLMPTHIDSHFTPEELMGARMAEPFAFTKGAPLMRIPVIERSPFYDMYGPGALLESETVLFDLETDPGQTDSDPRRRGRGPAFGRDARTSWSPTPARPRRWRASGSAAA